MPKKHLLNQIQLESLTSPIRLAIIQRLDIDKEATARELAQKMGRPVTSLYHHLKQLEEIGVLYISAERSGVRRPEAVYAMAVGRLSSAEAVKTAKGRKTYGRAGVRIADAGARAFSAAVTHGRPRFDGEHRNTTARHYVLRADKKKLAELNRLLTELEEAAAHSGKDGEEIQLTILLSPLRPKS
jgi:DNA-binding transcriptional ArsR family regulator